MGERETALDETAIEASRIMRWSGKRVFITGGTGFIGAGMVGRMLTLGCDVFVPTVEGEGLEAHPRLSGWMCDLRDRERLAGVLAEAQPDAVFHFAAFTQVTEAAASPAYTFAVNAQGTLNLLETIRTMGLRPTIVIASSDKAVGGLGTMLDPRYPLNMRPSHPYDMSKATADLIALCYSDFYGLDIQSVRTANVYGPGDDHLRRIVPGTFWSVLNGRRPVLRSDGTPVREYLYITDAIEAYLRTAEADHIGWRAILCPGERIAVLPLVRMILELCGSDLEPIIPGAETGHYPPFDETQEIRIAPQAQAETIGIWERVPLADGLKRTLAWMKLWKKMADDDEDQWKAGAFYEPET